MMRAHQRLSLNRQMGCATRSSTLFRARTTADVVCCAGASEHLQEKPTRAVFSSGCQRLTSHFPLTATVTQTKPARRARKPQQPEARAAPTLTFILSTLASIFSCSTSFLACAMPAVLLLAMGAVALGLAACAVCREGEDGSRQQAGPIARRLCTFS